MFSEGYNDKRRAPKRECGVLGFDAEYPAYLRIPSSFCAMMAR